MVDMHHLQQSNVNFWHSRIKKKWFFKTEIKFLKEDIYYYICKNYLTCKTYANLVNSAIWTGLGYVGVIIYNGVFSDSYLGTLHLSKL